MLYYIITPFSGVGDTNFATVKINFLRITNEYTEINQDGHACLQKLFQVAPAPCH